MHCLFLLITYVFPFKILNVLAAANFKVVDLTHEISDTTVYWPGFPAYNFTVLAHGRTDTGKWFEANYIGQAEHGGTHLDAPSHFCEGAKRTHQVPLERLHGPGVIIDVKEKSRRDPDYRVTVKDIEAWEHKHGRIPKKAAVIMYSGWAKKYPNKNSVFNTKDPSDPSTFHFPGWHVDTVRWLAINRDVYMVGVDTPSTDYGQSTKFPVHEALAKMNICGIEGVANLDKIPQSGMEIFVPVIKTKNGSGGPARVFALFVEDGACGKV